LRWASLIHDIGKLDVPGPLLRKRGKPNQAEWATLRLHPETGARITAPLAEWLGPYSRVAIEHHERFDGTGYPYGLKGTEISLGARIVALADAFEVMTAARPYKRASSRAAALREVARCSGTHFDPLVVRAFLNVSTPRLRKALGPASVIGQVPVIGTAPMSGLPEVAAQLARGAGTAVLGGVTGVVVTAAPTALAPALAAAPPAHTSTQFGDRVDTTSPGSGPTSDVQQPSVGVDRTNGASDGTAGVEQSVPSASQTAGSLNGHVQSGEVSASTKDGAPSTTDQKGSVTEGITGGTTSPATDGATGTLGGTLKSAGGLVADIGSVTEGAVGGPVGSVVGGVTETVSGVTDTAGGLIDGLTGGSGQSDSSTGSTGLLGKVVGGLLGRR
jgi:hypothetical protein